ncbi:MerR family transcriptional regulator [Falsibacillus albus]|uniref:MerR family transcriptional regulator n=1 Tax=Falsibacillus albus TaxID=2478915 RepID=A0A3L7JZF6_9BACI|nr:MerR family transcriptional regulator [Falsibacillus albus]RLQ95071.1 MerR family transcriptional regulator [Falsibacillus albus]
MSNHEEGKYNIKAVSKMLGIQPGTLRAWERRYNMIAPVRNESGHRLYTDRHVKILKWLVSKVNQGFTISQAVSLLDKQEFQESSEEYLQTDRVADELLQALLNFEEAKAQELINTAFALFTIDKVIIDILAGLLVKIGDLWENEKITTAHEHFATSILRSRIGMIMHSFPHNGILPKVVAVCGPGEWHELGLLIFTLYVRRKGFEVIYLGTSIKEEDLDIVLQTVNPKFLFLSCTMRGNLDKTLKTIDHLKESFPEVEIGVGGFAVDTMSSGVKEHYVEHVVGQSKKDWDNWLKSKMA